MNATNDPDPLRWWQWLLIIVLTFCCLMARESFGAPSTVTVANGAAEVLKFDVSAGEVFFEARLNTGEHAQAPQLGDAEFDVSVTVFREHVDEGSGAWDEPVASFNQHLFPDKAYTLSLGGDFAFSLSEGPLASPGTGSPSWFDATDFWLGVSCAMATVGTWFGFWFIKRSTNDAIE